MNLGSSKLLERLADYYCYKWVRLAFLLDTLAVVFQALDEFVEVALALDKMAELAQAWRVQALDSMPIV